MQMLIHLPDDLAARFRHCVPSRKRSGFVRGLLEHALPDPDEALYRLALKAEKDDAKHIAEAVAWDQTSGDGLDPDESFDTAKLALLCPK